MKATDREAYYWKAEYERLRRKYHNLSQLYHNYIITTWDLLQALGMRQEDIIKHYATVRIIQR